MKQNFKYIFIGSCLLFFILTGFIFSYEKISLNLSEKTSSYIIYADLNTIEFVEADVVFKPLEDSVMENVEITMQDAICSASNDYILESEEKLRVEKIERERKLELDRIENEKRFLQAVERKGNAILSYNPFIKSGLTIEEYNTILKGTGLEGCGISFLKMEETYGVNGLFAIGVAFHESGYGKYKANTNNFYGMRGSSGWMSFNTPDDNIQYFGKLMNKPLYHGKSIVEIGKIYCPNTYNSWANSIKAMMKQSFNKIL